MTRDNEIANAASEAMTETLMSYPMYEFSPKATDLLECAYIKGAEWADSHPANHWHKNIDGDLPKKSGRYLVMAQNGYCHTCKYKADSRYWDTVGYQSDIAYWMEIPELPTK